jgi:hypothetical protein
LHGTRARADLQHHLLLSQRLRHLRDTMLHEMNTGTPPTRCRRRRRRRRACPCAFSRSRLIRDRMRAVDLVSLRILRIRWQLDRCFVALSLRCACAASALCPNLRRTRTYVHVYVRAYVAACSLEHEPGCVNFVGEVCGLRIHSLEHALVLTCNIICCCRNACNTTRVPWYMCTSSSTRERTCPRISDKPKNTNCAQRTCIASKRRCSLENVRTFTRIHTAPRLGVAVCFALAHCRSHAHGATTEPSLPPGMRLNPGKWPKDRPWEGYVRTRDALNSGDVEVVDGVFVCRAHSTQDGRRVGCREYEELMMVRLALHAFSVVSACF